MEIEAILKLHLVRSLVASAVLAILSSWLLLSTSNGNPPWPFTRRAGFVLGVAGWLPAVSLLAFWARL